MSGILSFFNPKSTPSQMMDKYRDELDTIAHSMSSLQLKFAVYAANVGKLADTHADMAESIRSFNAVERPNHPLSTPYLTLQLAFREEIKKRWTAQYNEDVIALFEHWNRQADGQRNLIRNYEIARQDCLTLKEQVRSSREARARYTDRGKQPPSVLEKEVADAEEKYEQYALGLKSMKDSVDANQKRLAGSDRYRLFDKIFVSMIQMQISFEEELHLLAKKYSPIMKHLRLIQDATLSNSTIPTIPTDLITTALASPNQARLSGTNLGLDGETGNTQGPFSASASETFDSVNGDNASAYASDPLNMAAELEVVPGSKFLIKDIVDFLSATNLESDDAIIPPDALAAFGMPAPNSPEKNINQQQKQLTAVEILQCFLPKTSSIHSKTGETNTANVSTVLKETEDIFDPLGITRLPSTGPTTTFSSPNGKRKNPTDSSSLTPASPEMILKQKNADLNTSLSSSMVSSKRRERLSLNMSALFGENVTVNPANDDMNTSLNIHNDSFSTSTTLNSSIHGKSGMLSPRSNMKSRLDFGSVPSPLVSPRASFKKIPPPSFPALVDDDDESTQNVDLNDENINTFDQTTFEDGHDITMNPITAITTDDLHPIDGLDGLEDLGELDHFDNNTSIAITQNQSKISTTQHDNSGNNTAETIDDSILLLFEDDLPSEAEGSDDDTDFTVLPEQDMNVSTICIHGDVPDVNTSTYNPASYQDFDAILNETINEHNEHNEHTDNHMIESKLDADPHALNLQQISLSVTRSSSHDSRINASLSMTTTPFIDLEPDHQFIDRTMKYLRIRKHAPLIDAVRANSSMKLYMKRVELYSWCKHSLKTAKKPMASSSESYGKNCISLVFPPLAPIRQLLSTIQIVLWPNNGLKHFPLLRLKEMSGIMDYTKKVFLVLEPFVENALNPKYTPANDATSYTDEELIKSLIAVTIVQALRQSLQEQLDEEAAIAHLNSSIINADVGVDANTDDADADTDIDIDVVGGDTDDTDGDGDIQEFDIDEFHADE